jgi:hypothetical protein
VKEAERDPVLRRFERDAVGACLVMAVMAVALTAARWGVRTGLDAGLGVLGGGLLIAVSYRAIKGAADLLAAAGRNRAESPSGQKTVVDGGGDERTEWDARPAPAENAAPLLPVGRRAFLAVKFFTRYALLAVAAYVMLTCFRLHPVGVLAGATSPFVAALMQVARLSRARARRQHP